MDISKLKTAVQGCKYPNEKLMLEALYHIASGINILVAVVLAVAAWKLGTVAWFILRKVYQAFIQ